MLMGEVGLNVRIMCRKRSGRPRSTTSASALAKDAGDCLAFLPGGSVLVTERNGKLKRIEGGKVFPVTGVPAVYNEGQGGLFDVVAHPDFNNNGLIFLSYAHGAKQANGTRVARAKLVGNSLIEVTPIYTALPLKSGPVHFGARMAFLPDGTFLLATGDGFDWRERAQKLDSPLGKVMRLTIDGKVPPDNPFVSNPGAQGSIFTRGHRNPQGIAWADDGTMYASEFGQDTWDELNLITAGDNYGWPTVEGIADDDRFTDPVQQWSPDEASPSGIAIDDGSIWIANLRGERLREVPLDDVTTSTEHLVGEHGRLRDVAVAADGSLWVLTNNTDGRGDPDDGDDRILRIVVR